MYSLFNEQRANSAGLPLDFLLLDFLLKHEAKLHTSTDKTRPYRVSA